MKSSLSCLLLASFCATAAADEPVDYETQIKPILLERCAGCHGADDQQSGLRLDAVSLALEGGDRGPALVPGRSAESLLYKAIVGQGDVEKMPADGEELSAEQVMLIQRWIDEGAIAPHEDVHATRIQSDHWSFQPVVRSALPAVARTEWILNPIDQFILARLENEGIAPSPQADRETLIRRLSLDLRGLPPTIAEIDQFIGDNLPGAYERLVDRMFASPSYGERWGRHWLDVARYADSHGFTIDGPRSIWKYRDWVIGAINGDLPFDEFTIEQLAGDLLPDATTEQIIATGFHRNTLVNQEGGTDPEQFRIEAIGDRVDTTSTAFLGLTVGCAQCHAHKFDPIPQKNYYELFAILNNCDEPSIPVPTASQASRMDQLNAALGTAMKELAAYDEAALKMQADWESQQLASAEAVPAAIKAILDTKADQRSSEQIEQLRTAYLDSLADRKSLATKVETATAERKTLEDTIPTTMVLREKNQARETHVHIRGDFLRKGVRVYGNVPDVLPPLPEGIKDASRLDLARWLVDPSNPLTSRVTVNRFWQQFFGRGLVETENDFGTQGATPSHPELLDWLASEFVRQGWSMKSLHRLIVTSQTYRQSSAMRLDVVERDPANRLLARQTRLRVDAEVVRDLALAASGLMTTRIGGPGVHPPQPEGIYVLTQENKGWKDDTGPDRYRRGMYIFFWRSSPYPLMPTFDAPNANLTCTRRERSNTPLQALTLANDRAFMEMTQALAARILNEGSHDTAGRVAYAFHVCVGRTPTEAESKRLAEFVEAQRAVFATDEAAATAASPAVRPEGVAVADGAAWTAAARVLLNLDEFITRE